MEDQGMLRGRENQEEEKEQGLTQRRKAQKEKRKESNQALMFEGMIKTFKHMLHSPRFNDAIKDKLLKDMQEVINEEREIFGK